MVWVALAVPSSGHLTRSLFLGLLYIIASHSVVWGRAALAPPGSLVEMHTLRPHTDLLNGVSLYQDPGGSE